MDPHAYLRRQQRFGRIMGGLVVAAFATGAISYALTGHHHEPGGSGRHALGQSTKHRRHKASQPTPGKHSAQTGSAATTLATSFRNATHQTAPSDFETLAVPWANQTWRIDPIGITSAHNPNPTLWFGERTGAEPWHWIPSTLPGALNPDLPKPIYQALQLAWNLNQGQRGPNLGGSVQWSAITGHVGTPAGWTMQALPAAGSPLGRPTIAITVWMQSSTGSFAGYYGVATAWDAANAVSGNHGLLGLQANPGPLAKIAHTQGP